LQPYHRWSSPRKINRGDHGVFRCGETCRARQAASGGGWAGCRWEAWTGRPLRLGGGNGTERGGFAHGGTWLDLALPSGCLPASARLIVYRNVRLCNGGRLAPRLLQLPAAGPTLRPPLAARDTTGIPGPFSGRKPCEGNYHEFYLRSIWKPTR
jgi:hypothetical protein